MLVETKFKKLEKFDALPILEVKIILMVTMVLKTSSYFNRFTSILKGQAVKFLHGNQSKCLMKKNSSTTTTSNNKFAADLIYDNARIMVKFNGHFLKKDKVTYNHGPIVNHYVVYRLIPDTKDSSITLENCPFGAIKKQNSGIDKYKCSGCGIGFDSKGSFSHPSGGYGKNVVIFGADMSSSTHANNKIRSILVLGKEFIQGIE